MFNLMRSFWILVFVFSSPVFAHDYQSGHLLIEHPHAVKPVPGVDVTAGYLRITNNGSAPERLLAATAEFAKKSRLHRTEIVDGVAKMRSIPASEGILIPPGETVLLDQGGLHLMFSGVSEDFDIGQLRAARLLFDTAGTIEVEFVVVDPADLDEEPPTDHSTHSN
ncbi:MAG: copper chaperone PCu(A)C [Pseudomonadota bacterium]